VRAPRFTPQAAEVFDRAQKPLAGRTAGGTLARISHRRSQLGKPGDEQL